MKYLASLLTLLFSISGLNTAYAQDYSMDLALEEGSVRTQSYVIAGSSVRIYATVKNNSDQDLFGTVKFYDENGSAFIGEDQPVSIVANKTDDVFVDWKSSSVGTFPISARVIPWDEDADNPDNNKTTTSIYVDVDSDGDGIPDRLDDDDDNDGVPDSQDAFPHDPSESLDTDGDGIGNNVDDDDDGDGFSDIEDLFPTDATEHADTDGDGVGDTVDAFPQDAMETTDIDEDGLGDNADPDTSNKGPVPQIQTKDSVVSTKSIVTFNALKSNDADGEIVTYEWDFGEGVESTSVVVDKIFEKAGTYDVSLKVTDDKGEYRVATMSMTVIHRWQTLALLFIVFLFFVLLVYYLKTAKNELSGPAKKAPRAKAKKPVTKK